MARLREIEVDLLDEIEFHNKGMTDTATKVLLRAPSSKNNKDASRMLRIWRSADFKKNRAILSSLTEEQRKESVRRADEEDKKSDGNDGDEERQTGEELSDDFMGTIEAQSTDEEIGLLYESFKSLLKNGCGFVNDLPISGGIYEQLSFDDERFLCGVYAVDFLAQSQERKKGGKN